MRPAVDSEGARVNVRTSAGEYPVLVGHGLIERLPEFLTEYVGATRYAIISDHQVAPLHGQSVVDHCLEWGLDTTLLTFPAGEASKTRKSWSILTDEMLDAGMGRDSAVIAVGGGVTTDLAGFLASTFLRGVPVAQVPTSYLAMIDASVGGKTGVDTRAGKNLVGAFHPPRLVVVDPAVIVTLPRAERAQGLVEAFKHGAILDAEYFNSLADDVEPLLDAAAESAERAVLRSVRIKAQVVSEDEFEDGYRQILNFGHTVGHAIEAASDFSLGHGSAVALGMLAEADIGEAVGVTESGTRDRIRDALGELVPPGSIPIETSRVLGYLGADKKVRAGRPRYVLLRSVGEVDPGSGWTHAVPDATVEDALQRVLGQS